MNNINESELYRCDIESERKFTSLEEATRFVMVKWETEKEVLSIYTENDKEYYVLGIEMEEIAIQLDFKPILDLVMILNR